ncbi:endonuclease III domain-containing protein [Flavobacterium pallidum]|uniref:DNA lyase n=1 Tax=Flavobacterium pallidum TaxID=2172098 RepID=A0A2S1SIS3_9FLAO|nr:endonuclease III [Flavobacterium pallidum]AWI26314.1 DNA lyase [Flavobacterium pallidum]
MNTTDWAQELKPLIAKYKNKKHPLDYGNLYQLMVMVILSAQDSDAHINKVAPALFDKYPDLKSLAKAEAEDLEPYIGKVRNFSTKSGWLVEIAKTLKDDKNIPTTMPELIALKGIGRKSANVIMREAEAKAEGIMVDLHVLRVVPRLGISQAKTGDKMEKDMMAVLPQEMWSDVGMAISFLGRETCRPTNPKHDECLLSAVCDYCKAHG